MAESEIFNIIDIPEYVKKYDQQFKLKQIEKIILFIGETGKGKSTLTEFLTKNPRLCAKGNPGAFIIADPDDLISDDKSTIVSKTIIPRPVPQRGAETDTCYLDCPGFRDTRSTTMDIACMIFLKKALQNCRKAKIVFVLAYDDVKVGGQRNGFLDMVQQAGEFISNLDKFAESIALFVTKVPCEVLNTGERYELIPDDTFRQNVVEFLQRAEQQITSQKSVAAEKRDLHEKALKLIRFLTGSNHQQSRIGIFRAPDRKGPLQDMAIMQQSKKNLHNILNNVLEYSHIHENDFNFSLSYESKVYIAKNVPVIVKESGHAWELAVKEFIRIYQQWEKHKTNIDELIKVFTNEHTIWEEKSKALHKQKYTLDVYKLIYDYILNTEARIQSSSSVLNGTIDNFEKACSALANYTDVIELLQKVTNERFQQSTVNLLAPFEVAIHYSLTTKVWYQNLPIMFEELSKYRIEEGTTFGAKKEKDYFRNLEKFLTEGGCAVDDYEKDATPLYKLLSLCFGKEFSLPIGNTSSAKLNHLRRLYDIIFEKHATEHQQDTTIIKGNFIKLSSVSNSRTSKDKKLKIFATYKIFIDCDFERIGNNFELSIYAPKWEVIGEKRKIVLDGQPASDIETAAQSATSKPGSNGQDGVAGLPGGNGGHFIGVGSEIINSENLEVSACGGRGGKGQEGENGKNGDGGVDACVPESKSIWFWQGDLNPKADRVKDKKTSWSLIPFIARSKETSNCERVGKDGQPGGNGGDGGKGGAGGYAGSISFIGIQRHPTIHAENGTTGEDGDGGQGGKGGENGCNLKFEAVVDRPVLDLLNWKIKLNHENIETTHQGNAADGVQGKKGASDREFKWPEKNPNPDRADILKEYLIWFSNVTQSHPLQTDSRKFLERFKTIVNPQN